MTKSLFETDKDGDDKEPSASPMSKSLNSDNLEGEQKKVKFVGIDKISDKKIQFQSPEKLSQSSALFLPSNMSEGSSGSKL